MTKHLNKHALPPNAKKKLCSGMSLVHAVLVNVELRVVTGMSHASALELCSLVVCVCAFLTQVLWSYGSCMSIVVQGLVECEQNPREREISGGLAADIEPRGRGRGCRRRRRRRRRRLAAHVADVCASLRARGCVCVLVGRAVLRGASGRSGVGRAVVLSRSGCAMAVPMFGGGAHAATRDWAVGATVIAVGLTGGGGVRWVAGRRGRPAAKGPSTAWLRCVERGATAWDGCAAVAQ